MFYVVLQLQKKTCFFSAFFVYPFALFLSLRLHTFFICLTFFKMREHSAVFVKAPCVQYVYNLRNLILTNYSEFHSVSQYLSRVGLFTTADTPKGDVPLSAVGSIRDVKVILIWSSNTKIRVQWGLNLGFWMQESIIIYTALLKSFNMLCLHIPPWLCDAVEWHYSKKY